MVAIVVTLATTIQVLYLESLRIRARELPSLEFFKATLEAKIGLETELGALTFSLVKHLGLAVVGCLTLALTAHNASDWEALIVAVLLVAFFAILGTYVIPQIIYRKTHRTRTAAAGSAVPLDGAADASAHLGAELSAIGVRFRRPSAGR